MVLNYSYFKKLIKIINVKIIIILNYINYNILEHILIIQFYYAYFKFNFNNNFFYFFTYHIFYFFIKIK